MSTKARILSVTGTKGKTSVVRAVHHALQSLSSEPVLSVDTHRIVLGDEKLVTFTQSVDTSGLSPTVCPGRFLWSLKDVKQPVAVLESSIGSSQSPGLGYKTHEIGVFTNIYDDHLGVKEYLKKREDLAEAKSFIFSYIKRGGSAVYNADDELVCGQLHKIDRLKNITLIACGMRGEMYQDADITVTIQNDRLCVLTEKSVELSVPITDFPWLYGGLHQPTLNNALFIVGALHAYFRDDKSQLLKAIEALKSYRTDERGGRMVVKKADNDCTVIIDFAHETESLSQIATFARQLAPMGQVIGVVRLSAERPDEHIVSTAERFTKQYDRLVIYDKQAEDDQKYRERGEVPRMISVAAAKNGVINEIVLDEADALRRAYKLSSAEDAIVYVIRSSVGNYELADSVFHFKENNQ